MRIIGGDKKGIIIHPPQGLPVRPTTDRAKESLFNILDNYFNFEGLHVLDLFAGTGNISFEFASRGAAGVVAVDRDNGCIKFIRDTAAKLGFKNLSAVRKDAFTFIESCDRTFDMIFADAPYALPGIVSLPGLVANKEMLSENGWLVIEHATGLDISGQSGFFEQRKYGQSSFSFFKLHP